MEDFGFTETNNVGNWYWFEYPSDGWYRHTPRAREHFMAHIVVQFYAPASDMSAFIVIKKPSGYDEDIRAARVEGFVRSFDELEALLKPLIVRRMHVAVEMAVGWGKISLPSVPEGLIRAAKSSDQSTRFQAERAIIDLLLAEGVEF